MTKKSSKALLRVHHAFKLMAFVAFCLSAWSVPAGAVMADATTISQAVANAGMNPKLAAGAGNLAMFESGGNSQITNSLGYSGLFQMGQPMLTKFCACTASQYTQMSVDQQAQVYTKYLSAVTSEAAPSQLVTAMNNGSSINGVPITAGMVLGCVQLGGPNCQKQINYIQANGACPTGAGVSGNDANGTSICTFAAKVGDTSGNGVGPTNSTVNPDGSVSVGSAALATYCSQTVQQMLTNNAYQQIDARTAIASSGQTGYTLLNGQGVLNAAGLGGSGSGGLFGNSVSVGGGGTNSFTGLSCIDRLFNSGGLNVIFNPPNLSQIINMLEQAICNKAQQMFSSLMQPVSQMLSQATGSLGGGQMLGGGGFFPGISLSSLGGGINTSTGSGFSIGIGGVGQVGTTSGLGGIMNGSANWYSRSLPAQGQQSSGFTGLFGNGNSGSNGSSGGILGGLFGNSSPAPSNTTSGTPSIGGLY